VFERTICRKRAAKIQCLIFILQIFFQRFFISVGFASLCEPRLKERSVVNGAAKVAGVLIRASTWTIFFDVKHLHY
jgi:hypothetical protein